MKKTVLLIVAIAFVNLSFAQDLANCKNPCEVEKVVEIGAFLGVRISPLCNGPYAQVVEVFPNTAAERNHLAINDIIQTIDGVSIMNDKHVEQIINAHQPNDIIKIVYQRNENIVNKKIALGAKSTKIVTEIICCDKAEINNQGKTNNLIPANVNFILYPNPANNSLQISSDVIVTGNIEINIFDMLGNQVVSKKINDNKDVLNQKLSLVDLSSGNYVVKITNNDVVSVAKLVVSK